MKTGKSGMADVGEKKAVRRTAVAEGEIRMSPATVRAVRAGKLAKGDCLGTARVAAIMAVKNTPGMIPLCHPVKIDWAGVSFSLGKTSVKIICEVRAMDRTGVEMEALAGVSAAALTIYDMCKPIDKGMRISGIRLLKKTKR